MAAVIHTYIKCNDCQKIWRAGEMKKRRAYIQRCHYGDDGWEYREGKDYCEECRQSNG